MIIWYTGNTNAGKTTLARNMLDKRTILLDGDSLRYIWSDLGLSKDDRWEHNLRVAKLAKELDSQGFNVNVAVICPYEKLRKEVKEICGCMFMYVPYGDTHSKDKPYEIPVNPDFIYYRKGDMP